MSLGGRRSARRTLARAYAAGSGCRPPEVFVAASWNALDPDERRLIERHIEDCPACAAERDLARSFESAAASDVPDPEVDWIVAELERSRFHPQRRRRRLDWRWASAAALVLVGVSGWLALREGPPRLAPPSAAPVVLRGAAIELFEPSGDVAAPPRELRFAAVPGASRYRVKILEVDDGLLWEQEVVEPEAAIPEDVRARLADAVVYRFQVEAFDASGARLAVSAIAPFRVLSGAAKNGGGTP